jgi:hypothetical protein
MQYAQLETEMLKNTVGTRVYATHLHMCNHETSVHVAIASYRRPHSSTAPLTETAP